MVLSTQQSGRDQLPIETWLAQRLGRPVVLTFTQNRSTMMSWRGQGGILKVRLHEFFMRAPEEIWECIGLYMATKDAHAGKIIEIYYRNILYKYIIEIYYTNI